MMEKAVQRHQTGDLQGALQAYNDILAATADFPPALNMKGVCLSQMGQQTQALECLRKAVALKPDYVAGLCNLGNVQMDANDLAGAIDSFAKAVELSPQTAAIHTNLGLSLLKAGRIPESVTALQKAVELDPQNPQLKNNLGHALQKEGKPGEAAALFISIWQSSKLVDAAINAATVLQELGRLGEAETFAREASLADPKQAVACKALSSILLAQGRPTEAAEALKLALERGDTSIDTYQSLAILLSKEQALEPARAIVEQGLAQHPHSSELIATQIGLLLDLKRPEQAVEMGKRALAQGVRDELALANHATALNVLGKADETIACYELLLQSHPQSFKGWHGLGTVLFQNGQYQRASECFAKAFEIDPNYPFLDGAMFLAAMHACNWSNWDTAIERLKEGLARKKTIAPPFLALALVDDPVLHANAAKAWINDVAPKIQPAKLSVKAKSKIKIGYFSADYHNHATAYLMAELFERHDRSKFEVVGISFGQDRQDEMRQRLVRAFDTFVDVRTRSDEEVAELSREMDIDIAVDLKGYTGESRPGIFVHRAAPIQVNYLGHPGTMGTDCIDYIVVDNVICPPEHYGYYTEKVVALPHSYQVNDSKRTVSDKVFTRAEAGLPEDAFVFCCFNNNYKITPETFDSWMRILKQVNGSVLWLLEDNATAMSNLKAEASKRGVDSNRLVFAKRAKLDQHLARHKLADLFIDTLPYNAHTTTSDALWTGLPVLTLAGNSFPSRVAASLLTAVGLTELITDNRADYESLAVELAQNPARLKSIKTKLVGVAKQPLFDIGLFTRDIESAYQLMFDRALTGLPPENLSISDV